MKYYLFEYQIYHSGAGGICSSGSSPQRWDGTLKRIDGIKSSILLGHNKPSEYYAVRILSAIDLFGEE